MRRVRLHQGCCAPGWGDRPGEQDVGVEKQARFQEGRRIRLRTHAAFLAVMRSSLLNSLRRWLLYTSRGYTPAGRSRIPPSGVVSTTRSVSPSRPKLRKMAFGPEIGWAFLTAASGEPSLARFLG